MHGRIAAFGVATFGPAGVNPAAPDYGWITSTPKPHWAQTDLRGWILEKFGTPCGFDTDVNGAALAEWKCGAGMGCDAVLYITVGTGIGGGFALRGRCLHGLVHPEMGHIRVPLHPDDSFAGCCPWHGNCLEGLASGTAMNERWGRQAQTLPQDHPAWQMEAFYLGTAVANFILTLSPQRVILGGGVFNQPHLLPMVREEAKRCLKGYLAHPLARDGIDQLIVPPQLKIPGLSGAFVLAEEANHGVR
jgi:fructokinase